MNARKCLKFSQVTRKTQVYENTNVTSEIITPIVCALNVHVTIFFKLNILDAGYQLQTITWCQIDILQQWLKNKKLKVIMRKSHFWQGNDLYIKPPEQKIQIQQRHACQYGTGHKLNKLILHTNKIIKFSYFFLNLYLQKAEQDRADIQYLIFGIKVKTQTGSD